MAPNLKRGGSHSIEYDPRLAAVCGGVAPALLFCYFEKCFREAGYPAAGIERSGVTAWRTGLGYTQPQPWFKHFYRIGVIHIGTQVYRAAVRARCEFLSRERGGYLFYAMEVKWRGQAATLHRNAVLIEHTLALVNGTNGPVITKEHRGAGRAAACDAQEFSRAIEVLGALCTRGKGREPC